MKEAHRYTAFHPHWFREKMSTFWWLSRWPYLKFVLRELSSVAVALAVVMTLVQVRALRAGPQFYAEFERTVRSPLLLGVAVVCFGFVLFHTITWFNLTPRAMVLRVGGRRLPDALIAGSNYIAWLVVSGVVAWLVLRG